MSLFTRRTREKLWWNFLFVCRASSSPTGVGAEPSGASSSSETRQTAGFLYDYRLKYPLVNRTADRLHFVTLVGVT
jgi:hypothetical protein